MVARNRQSRWQRHFVYRTEAVKTTWKFRLAILIFVILLASLARGLWIPSLGRSLVCTEEVGPSDVILVENFDPNYLLFERAAALQRAGLSARVLVPTASPSGWRTILQKEADAYFLQAGSSAGTPASGGTFNGVCCRNVYAAAALIPNTLTHVATPTRTTYSDPARLPATSYSYRVRPMDAAGNPSPDSNIASATTSAATSGLVVAYGFNEGAGITVDDASGNSNTGTINGATWTPQGRFGTAFSFDGLNDLVVIRNSPSLNLTPAWTLEAWVYLTEGPRHDPEMPNTISQGIAELMARVARVENVEIIPTRDIEPISLNTAYQIRDFLTKEHLRSVIVVTPAFRSRRSSLVYRAVLRPAGIQVYCMPVYGEHTPENWTATWHGIQNVTEQFIKLQFYRFYVLPLARGRPAAPTRSTVP